MNKIITAAFLALSIAGSAVARDNGDGTFTNPVVWSDMPDPDVIRVDDTFYLVTTTMHMMPGAPVMKSADLVNWEMSSYIYDTLHETPKYDMEGGTVYGRGQWATSLRYRDGMFYALFSPNDKPYRSFIYRTENPDEGWTLHSRMQHFHDASLFFDDDGRVYVFSGTGELTELEPDLSDVKADGLKCRLNVRDEEETGLLEGSRVIKKDGKYYLLMISWPSGQPRRQLCYRADSIEGPYEKKVILLDNFAGFPYVGQGTIVDDAEGNWWGMIFQDRGGIGRVLTLSPCRWIDGWPMIGDENGRVPLVCEKPAAGDSVSGVAASDEFEGEMNALWQWNHNPVDEAWSLSERPGWLRLRTASVASNIFEAKNTLTQRTEGPACTATVKLDVTGMKDGDVAGVAAFNGHTRKIAVAQRNGKRYIKLENNTVTLGKPENEVEEVDVEELAMVGIGNEDLIYFRLDCDFRLNRDLANFYYSLDGDEWTKIGEPFRMIFDYRKLFMGTRFAVFNYATSSTGGYVDVDYFRYGVDDGINVTLDSENIALK